MAVNYILLFVLAIVCFIDIKTKHISDLITLTGIIAGLIYNRFGLNSILGIIVGVLAVYLLNVVIFQKLGGGDCKLFGMLGAFWGWQAVLFILVLSITLFIPYRVYFLMRNTRNVKAYSPFIGLASLILLLYAR